MAAVRIFCSNIRAKGIKRFLLTEQETFCTRMRSLISRESWNIYNILHASWEPWYYQHWLDGCDPASKSIPWIGGAIWWRVQQVSIKSTAALDHQSIWQNIIFQTLRCQIEHPCWGGHILRWLLLVGVSDSIWPVVAHVCFNRCDRWTGYWFHSVPVCGIDTAGLDIKICIWSYSEIFIGLFLSFFSGSPSSKDSLVPWLTRATL